MTTLGTVQTKYSKNWIYLNPDPFNGPNSWNVSNTEVGSSGSRIYAIPPMVGSVNGDQVDLTYSIIACKGLDALNRQVFAKDIPTVFTDTLTGIESIEGVSPIYTNSYEDDTVIVFNISPLPSVDTTTLESEEPSGYNGNSIVSLTTSLPLSATEAGGVATVTFDISTLEDA